MEPQFGVRDDSKMRASMFGQAALTSDLNGSLGLMYLVLTILYLLVDTMIPLLPPTKDCIINVHSDGF